MAGKSGMAEMLPEYSPSSGEVLNTTAGPVLLAAEPAYLAEKGFARAAARLCRTPGTDDRLPCSPVCSIARASVQGLFELEQAGTDVSGFGGSALGMDCR